MRFSEVGFSGSLPSSRARNISVSFLGLSGWSDTTKKDEYHIIAQPPARTLKRADMSEPGLAIWRTCQSADVPGCGHTKAQTCQDADMPGLGRCQDADLPERRHLDRGYVEARTCQVADMPERRHFDRKIGSLALWLGGWIDL